MSSSTPRNSRRASSTVSRRQVAGRLMFHSRSFAAKTFSSAGRDKWRGLVLASLVTSHRHFAAATGDFFLEEATSFHEQLWIDAREDAGIKLAQPFLAVITGVSEDKYNVLSRANR